MPIRPENRARYPADWDAISHRIRFERAGGRCECDGRCGRPADHLGVDGRCRNQHGQPAYRTGSKVVLTTAHLDHTPENCGDDNLAAMCQGCHLHYDREHHAQTRAAGRAAALAETGAMMLPMGDELTGGNLVQYVVAYPVLNQVGGMLLNPDGEQLAVDQRADARDLVEVLAAHPARDITRDLVVIPGWSKAPDGLYEAYQRWRAGKPAVNELDVDSEEAVRQARRLLGLDLT